MNYKVKSSFRDLTDKKKLYKEGDTYSHTDEKRVAFLVEKGFIEPSNDGKIKHVGGGWYELPNGEKVQGKEEAEQTAKEL